MPRADAHQGEYVPASEQRLAWLTGFTGSAGMAVVLDGAAALFVDGRYTLQAKNEVDPARFSIQHIARRPPAAWVGANIARGKVLGYDPWLLTPARGSALPRRLRGRRRTPQGPCSQSGRRRVARPPGRADFADPAARLALRW